jgi:hypothetical protein
MAHGFRRGGSLAALSAVALASAGSASADPGYSYFYTGQTGAQVQVDRFHTQHWSVSPTWDLDNFMGGRFKMKAGPQTVNTVTFLLFSGTYQNYLDNAYTALMSVTRTAAEVGYADYTFIDFFADSPLSLAEGAVYTGVLFSNAPQPQSRAFFIKDSFEFIEPPPPRGPVGGSPTPSAALLGAAGVAIALGRRRR